MATTLAGNEKLFNAVGEALIHSYGIYRGRASVYVDGIVEALKAENKREAVAASFAAQIGTYSGYNHNQAADIVLRNI